MLAKASSALADGPCAGSAVNFVSAHTIRARCHPVLALEPGQNSGRLKVDPHTSHTELVISAVTALGLVAASKPQKTCLSNPSVLDVLKLWKRYSANAISSPRCTSLRRACSVRLWPPCRLASRGPSFARGGAAGDSSACRPPGRCSNDAGCKAAGWGASSSPSAARILCHSSLDNSGSGGSSREA